ncbi:MULTISPECIES: ABC transporter substrate-binding protein [Agrobacterium]|uniref:Sugar ABC transporter substrate-binding protein n=1 Tax=Agrobacterium tumefaciens TaxID=358 RepID=A0AA44F283_AGRTU|nr:MULTISPECIES: sugar ABC transporter substrate-binding protein [Agrobacterium]MDP9562469.1 multiple sugar transport system substrate-binding protein [Rhizobium nepotum]MDP9757446.1 multiple sugar transport system substrate-binding protein [Agrobacterium tumefaciens]MDQ1218679.1 multiple sugar transport system substrate-binding protein [Agrobacterium sp. SORGH_AS_0745]NSL23865.1 sugar ABC transporter substrate-binding protein [Agrobacterium tumefaciens]NTB87126.1 sugar ABC transporter substra
MNSHLKMQTTACALALIGSLALAGAAAAQDAVKLRMTIWSANEAHLKLFNDIAAGFKKDHPNVSVTYESLPFDTYTTALTTQIAGGNAPDMAWIFETSAYDFVKSGALYPLTDTLKAAQGYNLDEVSAGATERWSQDGKLFAYPFSTSPFAVFVNNDLIKAAGAKTPAEMIAAGEWTWENAIATASAVSKSGKGGLVVRDFNYQSWQYLTSVWNGWGASPWSADGATCTMAEKPMADALWFIHDAIFSKKAMPGPGETVDFFAGNAAMTITQISRASLLPKDKPFGWDLVPLPKGPAGEYALIGQAGIGVMQSGKNAQTAAEFVAYMTNPENSAKLSQFFPSARKSLLNAEVLKKTNPLLSQEQIEKVVISGIATGKVMPGHTGFAQIQQIVRSNLDAVWRPEADVAGALQKICGQIAPLLKR